MQRSGIVKSILIMSLLVGAIFSGAGCASDSKNTGKGAGIGAVAGAGLGAIIGHQTGNRGKGAAIGAILGAGLGGTIGHRMDKQAKELAAIAETKRTDEGLVTKLKSDILFDTGKADLKAASEQNLSKMASIMKKYPENVLTVKGYTDSTGSMGINQSLSLRRAEAVRAKLVAGGIPMQTTSTVGMGPENPVAANTTPAGRMQNRRVEVEVTVDESKVPKE